jgi:FAD/FMN-containing dehydrogenase
MDVVTADGTLVHAGQGEHPDLDWGLRGGGGNFGIVTSFEYRLHPFDPIVYGGHLVYPASRARELLANFAEHFPQAPDELWIDLVLAVAPDGTRLALLDVCWSGDPAAGEKAVARYRLPKPIADTLAPAPYVRLQSKDDQRARHGRHYYTKSGVVKELSVPLIDMLVDAYENAGTPNPRIAIAVMGGAISRVPRDATAFWHRESLASIVLQGSGDDGAHDAAHIDWVRATWERFEPFTLGAYSNFAGVTAPSQGRQIVYGGNYQRLVRVKDRYDPTNLFRLNANVKPSGKAV